MADKSEPLLSRRLSEAERELVAAAREKCHILYEGKRVPHRSCGIALAETFNLRTAPYQSLRRGGITGQGECGSIKAGELILGEYLGDPAPTGPVTAALRDAAAYYRQSWQSRIDRGQSHSIVCNDLTEPFTDFHGAERQSFCTQLAATVAELVAETLLVFGARFEITPIPEFENPSRREEGR